MKIKNGYFILIILFILIYSSAARAQSEDESALFTTLAPDALILLDTSGSMNWTPAGKNMYMVNTSSYCNANVYFYEESGSGHTKLCTFNSDGSGTNGAVPKYSNTACTGPFVKTKQGPYQTDCSRLEIAKRGLFAILDDTGNGILDSQDETALNIRFAYMRFTNCGDDEPSVDYTSNCNRLIWPISTTTAPNTGTHYYKIYCNGSTQCDPSIHSSNSISGESASGGTPLASALKEAKAYLDYHRDQIDTAARACRSKFVILITDGADTSRERRWLRPGVWRRPQSAPRPRPG